MNLRVILVAFVMFVIGLSAVCEAQGEEGERIVEIWTCTLNDGYSMEDIESLNARWLALILSEGREMWTRIGCLILLEQCVVTNQRKM